jgi:hypothetical protein
MRGPRRHDHRGGENRHVVVVQAATPVLSTGPAVVSARDAVSTPENDEPPIERPSVEVEKVAVIVVPDASPDGA